MYRYNIEEYEFVEKDDYLLKKSYQIGNVSFLQPSFKKNVIYSCVCNFAGITVSEHGP